MENILTKATQGVARVARNVATEVKATPEKVALGVSVLKNNAKAAQADKDIQTIARGKKVKDIPFVDPRDPNATDVTRADASNPNFRDKVEYDRVMRTVAKPKAVASPTDYTARAITKK